MPVPARGGSPNACCSSQTNKDRDVRRVHLLAVPRGLVLAGAGVSRVDAFLSGNSAPGRDGRTREETGASARVPRQEAPSPSSGYAAS